MKLLYYKKIRDTARIYYCYALVITSSTRLSYSGPLPSGFVFP